MKRNKIRLSHNRASAAAVGGNDDLLTEILLFLPAKTLVRFKLVSKHWRSLISARSFSRRHTLHHRRRSPELHHSFILGYIDSQFFVCDPTVRRLIPFRFGFPFVRILQSCNGLLLLRCSYTLTGSKLYYVFNPTTLHSRKLVMPDAYCSNPCLIFDPYLSPYYRVVCVWSPSGRKSFVVYNSETKKWKESGRPVKSPLKFCNGICLDDDVVHLIGSRYSSFRLNPGDEIGRVDDPPLLLGSPGAKKSYIMESNGHLHQVTLSLKRRDNMLIVYEMKGIESGWCSKYYALDFNPSSAAFSSSDNKCAGLELLGMIRGERGEESMLLLHVPGKIMIYRFDDQVFELLVDFSREVYFVEGRLQFGFKDAHPFIHSLASV